MQVSTLTQENCHYSSPYIQMCSVIPSYCTHALNQTKTSTASTCM